MKASRGCLLFFALLILIAAAIGRYLIQPIQGDRLICDALLQDIQSGSQRTRDLGPQGRRFCRHIAIQGGQGFLGSGVVVLLFFQLRLEILRHHRVSRSSCIVRGQHAALGLDGEIHPKLLHQDLNDCKVTSFSNTVQGSSS